MARGSGIGQEEVRRVNLSALLSRVHASGPTSRAALTAELGLNRSTIGDLTGQLAELGLVREVRPTTSPGNGRPSHLVVPRRDVTVVAVALDVDGIVSALVGLGGVVLERRERLHRAGTRDCRAVVLLVAEVIRELLRLPAAARCLGIGVSLPGIIRASDGLVRFAPNLGWVDEPFTAMLEHEVELPLRAGNDGNLGVLAEHLRGAAVGFTEVAYIGGTVGIGGGFLVAGSLLRGSGGYAGEIGHLLVDNGGAVCRCGARGCWETRVGEDQLLLGAGRPAGGGPAAVTAVIFAADAGDAAAAGALDDVAHWIGVGLRGVVNVFNPQAVVLGGVLAKVWTARASQVLDSMSAGGPGASREDVRVVAAGLGEDSTLIGAAELGFARVLADPLGAAIAAADSQDSG